MLNKTGLNLFNDLTKATEVSVENTYILDLHSLNMCLIAWILASHLIELFLSYNYTEKYENNLGLS